MREDLELRSIAALAGWEEQLSIRDRGTGREPKDSIVFCKGDKRLWSHSGGATCADLTGDGFSTAVKFRNHRHYPTLAAALEKE